MWVWSPGGSEGVTGDRVRQQKAQKPGQDIETCPGYQILSRKAVIPDFYQTDPDFLRWQLLKKKKIFFF